MDTDTWWHLRAGEWIWEQRAIPRVDVFSYTRAGTPWQYPGWLVELPVWGIYRAFGPGGLNLWTAAMVTLAFIFVWQTLSGGQYLRAFILVLAAAASGVYWAARPYMVTFVLSAVFLWILENNRCRPGEVSSKRLWWLPVLMLIWANSHGGFAVGFILWGVYWLREVGLWLRNWCSGFTSSLKLLTFVGVGMLLAVCVNPYGVTMLAYPFKTVSIGALKDYIQEWQSPDFHLISVQPFVLLFLLTLAAVGFSRKRMLFTDFALISIFTYMALLAGRNIALFALVCPMVLTRHAAPPLEALARYIGFRPSALNTYSRGKKIINSILLGLTLLVTGFKVSLIFPDPVNEETFRKSLPIDAVSYIRQVKPPGRLFNSYNWGGYLLWALPEYPVFVDGRTDLYNDEVLGEWLRIVRAEEGWQEALDRWGVHLVLLEPDMPLVKWLKEKGWNLLYSDEVAVVYGR